MGRGFAKLLKKARRNRITIIAVNSSGGSTRSVTLPVLAAAVVILVSVGLFASMIGSYAVMRSSLIQSTASHEIKDTRIERLVSENTELRMIVSAQQLQLEFQEDQIHAMAQKVQSITDLGQEIIDTLGSEIELPSNVELTIEGLSSGFRSDAVVSIMGAGGVDRAAPPRLLADTLRTFKVSSVTSSIIAALDEKLASDLEVFKSLRDESVSYVHRLRHTPMGWPVVGPVSSRYGWRAHPVYKDTRFHNGIDIAVSVGTPVKATADGVVILSGTSGGYGLTVIIDHGYGVQTLYAHNSRLLVKAGEVVTRGQVISYSGNTGVSTGPHLHYEVRVGGKAVDPSIYMD
ncbi:MAG TPA: M23 family metallopeptidase [Bacillota bacterium]|jgi:murein DD-endopeptidase MepM/ murein hydrolase activator NlpD|nr:M23 family metallopeptidase [Bacillota bacterium]HOB92126.1 M23 family metallopeptidase [Bacillota bacterium]HPZ55164.1 M23 family metallopeptidase [Bacillota bacterium]HQD18463.1 M23 family metallopeptidase [Bacillota bacterium]